MFEESNLSHREIAMTVEDGVIKFRCNWLMGQAPEPATIADLMQWRDRLHTLGLIGTYPNGIGFGNISQRICTSEQFAPEQFVITGTQTGHLSTLGAEYYTRVTAFSLAENSLTCVGKVKASSESLTHAAIYANQPWVTGIIHGHHPQLWQMLLFQEPTTRQHIPYGTPQMAWELHRLFAEEDLGQRKILAMAGHDDGVMTIGKDLDEAGAVLLAALQRIRSSWH